MAMIVSARGLWTRDSAGRPSLDRGRPIIAIALQEMDFALNVLRGIAGLVPEVIVPLPVGWSG